MRGSIIGVISSSVGLFAPAAPSGVTITQDVNSNSFDVSFTDNSGGLAQHLVEYEVNNNGTWTIWATLSAGITSSINKGVTGWDTNLNGKQVSVRITALGDVNSATIETASPIIASFTAPSSPTTFTISEDLSGNITGTYSNVTNETHYWLEYNWNDSGWIYYELNLVNDTSMTTLDASAYAPTVVDGDTWQMRVRSGRYGAYSLFKTSNVLFLSNQGGGGGPV